MYTTYLAGSGSLTYLCDVTSESRVGMQSNHRDTVSKPRASQGRHRTAKTTEKWVTGGRFVAPTNMVEAKRTIEVAMVATNRYLDRIVQITEGNNTYGEGRREPSKTTSWPQSLFKKTPSAHFDSG